MVEPPEGATNGRRAEFDGRMDAGEEVEFMGVAKKVLLKTP